MLRKNRKGKIILVNYRKLVESPYIDSVEWSKWHVFWVDERVVPKDHEDSNYKLAYDCFLSKVCPIPLLVKIINTRALFLECGIFN